jgi:hypothetical protein
MPVRATKRGAERTPFPSGAEYDVVICGASFAGLAVAYVRIDLPKALPPVQTTFVTDRNGELLTTFHGSVDRTIIPLSKMPHF